MEQVILTTYLVTVLWIGFAITGDAFFSTLGQFHNQKLGYWNWAGFLALTHGLFPAVSFYLFLKLASISSELSLAVSVIGVALILAVVHEIMCDAFGTEPIFSLSDSIEKWTPLHKHKAKHFVKVLAVSWDALTLGPLLIIESQLWQNDTTLVAGMFVVFAVIVGISLAVTLRFTAYMRTKHFSDLEKMTRFNFYGSFFEVSVISSFAVTLLLDIFSIESNLWSSLFVSLSLFLVVYATNREALWNNAKAEAVEAIAE